MTRWLLLAHRYLGIAICLLMAAWCVSGAIMLFVPYPGLTEAARLQALPPLRWQGCCNWTALRATLGAGRSPEFRVEMQAGSPMLVSWSDSGAPLVVDLASGEQRGALDVTRAAAIARDFAHTVSTPRLLGLLDYDQWTVSGEYSGSRPLWHFALGDAAGTEIYVSGQTGDVVQRTTRWQRAWNYPGAVTHWLYATRLRANGAAWSRLIIGLAIAGVFLTAVGLYVGVAQWWRTRPALSPHRGAHLWHHLSGLVFGALALAWVGSGLVSMNPGGWLESSGTGEARAVLRGGSLDNETMVSALEQWLARHADTAAVSLSGAPFAGALRLLASDGTRAIRYSAAGEPAPLGGEELHRAALAIGGTARVSSYGLLHAGDDYYYGTARAGAPVFPVYAFILDDGEQTRYYLDPRDGSLLRRIDAAGRGYRWWFSALHRWDFTPALRRSPWHEIVVLALLGGVAALCLTGVWLGCRRVARSLA